MAQEFSRARRVGEQIRQILAQLIQREVKDPRIGMVTITAVKVSKDFEYARIFISVLDAEKVSSSLDGLNHAAGFLRTELSHQIKLRCTPKLIFEYDATLEEGNRLTTLIDKAVAADKKREH
jgi:ribosome-binding factor A